MNLDQRSKLLNLINQTQGLLAYAVKTADKAEVERLTRKLVFLMEKIEE